MIDETEFFEDHESESDMDIMCHVCGATMDLIFEDDGSVICDDCFHSMQCDDD